MERHAIGLIGWGTVGGGVIEVLGDGQAIAERCGLDLRLTRIVTRDPARARAQDPGGAEVSDRLESILEDPAIGTVIHLVGGVEVATAICERCLVAGKHVVTANKAMLAVHGDRLFAAAAEHGVSIAFEAAVAGGIPLIAALRDGLVANRIDGLHAILNGTCNYILSRMHGEPVAYEDALREAQRLGYAEADPTIDIDGTDTAHKLSILARIAFHTTVPLADIRCQGIQQVRAADIVSAKRMDAVIKLVATAELDQTGVILSVAPTFVSLDHPLAHVDRNGNGIQIRASAAGATFLSGLGAGGRPTASAILADVVDICSGRYQHTARAFRFFHPTASLRCVPADQETTALFVRWVVADRPGVLAGITSALSRHGLSVQRIHQGAPDQDGHAIVEVVTHPCLRGTALTALQEIDHHGMSLAPATTYRWLS